MTREELDFIGSLNMCDEISNETYKKIVCHYEEQELCEDAISREATLKPYNGLNDEDTISVWLIRKNIEQQPFVNPQPKWIPVSERLPEENVPVLLGIRFKDDFKYFVTVRMDVTYWSGIGRELKGTGYWMPLPAPYESYESEDKG